MPVSRNIQQGCSGEETCFTTFVRKTLLTSLLPLRDPLHLPRRHSHLPLIENLENLNQLELERLLLDDSESEFLELVIELSSLEFNELEGSLEIGVQGARVSTTRGTSPLCLTSLLYALKCSPHGVFFEFSCSTGS